MRVGTESNTIRRDRNAVCWPALASDPETVVIEVVAGIRQINRDNVLVVSDAQQVHRSANITGRAFRYEPAETNVLAGFDSFQSVELNMYRFVVEPDLLGVVIVVAKRVYYV